MNITRILKFLKTDIWRIRRRDLTARKWLLVRLLRIVVLALRGFSEDQCQLRASALTFYSLLSIVPVVAMVFGIAKGFGFEKTFQSQLVQKLEGQEEIINRVIEFAHALLENAKGGLIAGIGIVILFWTIIKVFSNIEGSFNDIWGIKTPRTLGRRISDYLSLILICPILFVLSSTLTVLIAGQVRLLIDKVSLLGPVGPLILPLLNILPYGVIWALFTFIYIFMPNTKVDFKSGLLAGVISGTLFQIFQMGYIHFQVGVAKYNAIYGGFAALPLFLIWLQISWLILLLGAEISFAHQNVDTYEFEPDCLKVSHYFKELLSLRVVHLLAGKFIKGEPPTDEARISHDLEIPVRLLRQILFELTRAGIVSQIKVDNEKTAAYQPALNPETLTIKSVLDALDHQGTDNIPVAQSEEMRELSDSLKTFGNLIERSPANKFIKDI